MPNNNSDEKEIKIEELHGILEWQTKTSPWPNFLALYLLAYLQMPNRSHLTTRRLLLGSLTDLVGPMEHLFQQLANMEKTNLNKKACHI